MCGYRWWSSAGSQAGSPRLMEAWATGEACPSLQGKPSCSPALGRGALAARRSSPQAPAEALSPGACLLPEDSGCQRAVVPISKSLLLCHSLEDTASPGRSSADLSPGVLERPLGWPPCFLS